MSSYILATGTSVPPNSLPQDSALKMFHDLACSTSRQRRLADVLFDRAGVNNRFTIVPYQSFYQWCVDENTDPQMITRGSPLTVAPQPIPTIDSGTHVGISTGQRMRLYDLYAADIAIESATQAIQTAECDPSEITHLVIVTCTGFASPGVDVKMIKTLGLPATTQRINVGFMGCHGAVNGIRAAMNITKADANAKVLVCCVELCSLHCRFQWTEEDHDKIVGNALFGDGSASLIIGGERRQQKTDWEIIDTGSTLIEDSEAELCWNIGDHGFEMILSSEIGGRIEGALSQWLTQWLEQRSLSLDDIDCWAVHPGGPKIIRSVQQSLNLNEEQLSVSLDVLSRFGNMSSPTVLFILESFKKAMDEASTPATDKKHALIIAFGPGMVSEVALLSRH